MRPVGDFAKSTGKTFSTHADSRGCVGQAGFLVRLLSVEQVELRILVRRNTPPWNGAFAILVRRLSRFLNSSREGLEIQPKV